VKEYYDKNALEEWKRLFCDPYHNLEFLVTKHFLEMYLPTRGLVLDAGGGPGRYTIELAHMGYELILFDLSTKCLEIAEKEIERAGVKSRVKKTVHGSITNLSEFENESFDAVLCLGALPHLISSGDRSVAVSELVRVARRDAPIFISVINSLGTYRNILQQFRYEIADPSHRDVFLQKVHREEWHRRLGITGFTDAYLFSPAELKELVERYSVRTLDIASCEGLSAHLQEETNTLYQDKNMWQFWLDLVIKTCNDPCILGSGEHLLYVGRKARSK